MGPLYCTTARKIGVQNSINRVCLYACHCVCVYKRVCVCLLRLRNLSRLNSLFTKVLQHITQNREYFINMQFTGNAIPRRRDAELYCRCDLFNELLSEGTDEENEGRDRFFVLLSI